VKLGEAFHHGQATWMSNFCIYVHLFSACEFQCILHLPSEALANELHHAQQNWMAWANERQQFVELLF